ncbi:MAG: hypothetical protein ACREMZ_12865 [Gemmatimonadales bacterium]
MSTTATLVLDLTQTITEIVERTLATRGGTAPDPALALRDRLWAGPAALRLTMKELALALGVSRQTVKRLMVRGLPHRTNALGDFTFVAGEARAWLERQERTEAPVLPLRRTGT